MVRILADDSSSDEDSSVVAEVPVRRLPQQLGLNAQRVRQVRHAVFGAADASNVSQTERKVSPMDVEDYADLFGDSVLVQEVPFTVDQTPFDPDALEWTREQQEMQSQFKDTKPDVLPSMHREHRAPRLPAQTIVEPRPVMPRPTHKADPRAVAQAKQGIQLAASTPGWPHTRNVDLTCEGKVVNSHGANVDVTQITPHPQVSSAHVEALLSVHHGHYEGKHVDADEPWTVLIDGYLDTLTAATESHTNVSTPDGYKFRDRLRYEYSVWQLIHVLHGKTYGANALKLPKTEDIVPLSSNPFQQGLARPRSAHESVLEAWARRESLSDWVAQTSAHEIALDIKSVAMEAQDVERSGLPAFEIKNQLNACDQTVCFLHLTGHQIVEASELALSTHNGRLGLLLCQAGQSSSLHDDMSTQIALWRTSHEWVRFDPGTQCLYQLLAGPHNGEWKREPLRTKLSELDWLRAFGLFLWYGSPGAAPAVQNTVPSLLSLYEQESLGAHWLHPPLTLHARQQDVFDMPEAPDRMDVRYHLISHFCSRDLSSLSEMLSPLSNSASALDYCLSWLIFDMLCDILHDQLPFEQATTLYVNFATQLEMMGLWHWAIYVIHRGATRLKDHIFLDSERIVNDILERHCDVQTTKDKEPHGGVNATTSENNDPLNTTAFTTQNQFGSSFDWQQLSSRFDIQEGDTFDSREQLLLGIGIPKEWIHRAKAGKAAYRHLYFEQCVHLAFAGDAGASVKVFVQHLEPACALQYAQQETQAPVVTKTGDETVVRTWSLAQLWAWEEQLPWFVRLFHSWVVAADAQQDEVTTTQAFVQWSSQSALFQYVLTVHQFYGLLWRGLRGITSTINEWIIVREKIDSLLELLAHQTSSKSNRPDELLGNIAYAELSDRLLAKRAQIPSFVASEQDTEEQINAIVQRSNLDIMPLTTSATENVQFGLVANLTKFAVDSLDE